MQLSVIYSVYVLTVFHLIYSVEACCDLLLMTVPLRASWVSLFILLLSMAILTCVNISTSFTLHSCVSIHALINQSMMFSSNLLILTMHYSYGLNYPLLASSRSGRVDCIFHSALSSITILIPSSTLVLLSVIHYRAIFWAQFSYKLEVKHILRFVILIWLASILLTVLWTTLHEDYSGWYCHPPVSTVAWFSIVLQSVVSIVCVSCLCVCVGCYSRMITHLHTEEKAVKPMRSRQMSHTKTIASRFIHTLVLHLAQGGLLNTMMWLSLLGYGEQIVALCNAVYILTVAVTDVYLHTYILLKNILLKTFRKKL